MKQFFNVFKFELAQKFKDKVFIISLLITTLLVFGLTFIPGLFSTDKNSNVPTQVSTDQKIKNEEDKMELLLMYDGKVSDSTKEAIKNNFKVVEAKSLDEIKQKVDNKEVKKGAVISGDLIATVFSKNEGLSGFEEDELKSVLEENYKYNIALKNAGISNEVYDSIAKSQATIESVQLGKNGIVGYVLSYIMLMFLYFTILMNGQVISTSVAKEKSSRAMEILITNVKSKYLIWGKVLAGMVSTVVQVLGLGIAIYAGYMINFKDNAQIEILINMMLESLKIFDLVILSMFVFFGVLMYYFIFAALGSLVNKVEDLGQAIAPVTILIVLAFVLPLMSMSDPNSIVITIASYIPFSSPLAIFPRYLMTDMQTMDILISFGILFVTTILASILSIKIYRQGTLNYGNKLNVIKVLTTKID